MSSSSSLSSSISSLITVPTLNGQSTYSQDFQNILTKAAASDSIQLTALQAQETSNQNQLTALEGIANDFASLQTAISGLTTAIGSGSYEGSTSDSNASVTVSSGANAGVYTLQVLSLGSTTQTVSADGLTTVTDPTTQNISSASSFTLTVNGAPTTITPVGNDLQDLVNAINQQNLGVSASIVDVGSPSSPDYRLAVQSTGLADDTIQLSDGTNNSILNTVGSPGSPATYQVDGLATTISSDSSTVTLAPGVTATLLAVSPADEPTTITVKQTATATQTALQTFATAYNAVLADLVSQHGEGAGALQGNSILDAAQQVLEGITNYLGSGSVRSLSDLGLTVSTTGQMSFDASQFSANAGSNVNALSTFLGTATTGFLGSATASVNGLVNVGGLIPSIESAFNTTISSLGTQVTAQAAHVNSQLQTLQNQLSASDATISVLAGQVTYFTDLFFPPSSSNG